MWKPLSGCLRRRASWRTMRMQHLVTSVLSVPGPPFQPQQADSAQGGDVRRRSALLVVVRNPRHSCRCICASSLPGGVHVSQRMCDGVLGRFVVADANLAQLLVQMQRVEHLAAHGLAALLQVTRAPGLRDHAQERVAIGKDTTSDTGIKI